jgi:hypothetical protein
MTVATTPMILDTAVTFADLDAAVTDLGWVRHGTTAAPPLVPGEPEVATWTHPLAGTLVYTCNPVVWLRVLDLGTVERAAAVALAVRLPHLGESAIAALLRAGPTELVLLGVLAAGVQRSPTHLNAVRALLHHRDPAVAQAAIATARMLVEA